jgi:two-component system sensor histidine kinase/response regulator
MIGSPRADHGVTKPTEPGAVLDRLATIPGLDIAAGLQRMLGHADAYIGLLQTFTATRAGTATEIRAALAEDRRADAQRAAHSLKGEAGTIGADTLQRQAAEVEAAIRGGAGVSQIEPVLGLMQNTLDETMAAFVRILPSVSEPAPMAGDVDPVALRASVDRLDALLAEFDADAIKALDADDPLFSAAFGERAKDLRTLVKGYRFAEALRLLRDVTEA